MLRRPTFKALLLLLAFAIVPPVVDATDCPVIQDYACDYTCNYSSSHGTCTTMHVGTVCFESPNACGWNTGEYDDFCNCGFGSGGF